MAIYSVGFFLFWVFAAASSALTCFFQRTSAEINRCPLPAEERPVGCPKRSRRERVLLRVLGGGRWSG